MFYKNLRKEIYKNYFVLKKMKKNFKTLTKKLDLLTNQTQNPINIYTSSIFAIMQYKLRLRKKKHLEKKIKKLNDKKNKFISKFDSKIEILFNNQKISCRKYCKMESWLTYKKEKLLYKYGYASKRPISPTIKSIMSKLFPNSNFLNSSPSVLSNNLIFKEKLTNIAINTTKKCIKGYRKLEHTKQNARKSLLKNSLIKKLLYIKNQALQQLEEEKSQEKHDNPSEFLTRIQIDPKTIVEATNKYQSVKTRSPIMRIR